MITLTNKWKTICTIGYSATVNPWNENRSAHGGVCHCQARTKDGKILARKVNSNGRAEEIGRPYEIDKDQLEHWERIEKSSR